MPIRLNGSTSGYTELSAPAVAGNNSIALPTGNGSAYQILRNGATAGSLEYVDNLVLGTAQNSTSGTSIDFTGIPSWVKRVTVMFSGVSTSGASHWLVQIGNATFQTSGYASCGSGHLNNIAASVVNSSAGFLIFNDTAVDTRSGNFTLVLMGNTTYTANHNLQTSNSRVISWYGAGVSPSVGLAIDRLRITTVNGTDTFDAGSINILYE